MASLQIFLAQTKRYAQNIPLKNALCETTECVQGNAKFEMSGGTMDMVYFKQCGINEISCEFVNPEEPSMQIKECNIKFCEGDLCNNATTEEVEAYSHGDTFFACSFLYAAMTYLWLFVY